MEPTLPRVAITYCTQCKWMLRAAYFGQELLSTFGTTIGEIALIPATGGVFTVHLTYKPAVEDSSITAEDGGMQAQTVLLWDRKAEGGFPETKILKQRVRNHLDPKRDLGHSDTPAKSSKPTTSSSGAAAENAVLSSSGNDSSGNKDGVQLNADGTVCTDCA